MAPWRHRFLQGGIDALRQDAPRFGRTPTITAEGQSRILEVTLPSTPATATPWSTRSLAEHLGLVRPPSDASGNATAPSSRASRRLLPAVAAVLCCHEDFATLVLPSGEGRKPIPDTLLTVEALENIGVPAGKIRLPLEKMELSDGIAHDFATITVLAE